MDGRTLVSIVVGWMVGGLLFWIHLLGQCPGWVCPVAGTAAALLVFNLARVG
jgi:hypothetical protein